LHPLLELNSQTLDKKYFLQVITKLRHYFEQKYFELFILDENGHKFHPYVFSGIYSAGRVSSGINGWIDGDYYEKVSSNDLTLYLPELKLDIALFKKIGALIPNGGSLMVAYTMFWEESEVHKNTYKALDLGVPSLATPIGYLLFHAGCWADFKNWYFPEGGNEGPKKLQGFKPLNREDARTRAAETIRLLKSFINKKQEHSDLDNILEERSKEIINTLYLYLSE